MRAKRRGGKRRSLGTPTPPVREDGDRNLEVPGEEKTEAEREGPVTSGRRGKKKVIPTLTVRKTPARAGKALSRVPAATTATGRARREPSDPEPLLLEKVSFLEDASNLLRSMEEKEPLSVAFEERVLEPEFQHLLEQHLQRLVWQREYLQALSDGRGKGNKLLKKFPQARKILEVGVEGRPLDSEGKGQVEEVGRDGGFGYASKLLESAELACSSTSSRRGVQKSKAAAPTVLPLSQEPVAEDDDDESTAKEMAKARAQADFQKFVSLYSPQNIPQCSVDVVGQLLKDYPEKELREGAEIRAQLGEAKENAPDQKLGNFVEELGEKLRAVSLDSGADNSELEACQQELRQVRVSNIMGLQDMQARAMDFKKYSELKQRLDEVNAKLIEQIKNISGEKVAIKENNSGSASSSSLMGHKAEGKRLLALRDSLLPQIDELEAILYPT